jgi:hypothetical protein
VVLAAAAAWTTPAWAQLVVSDPPVEQFTGEISQSRLPSILQQDTATATSVTTGGGGGNYTSNAQSIASLDQGLFANVNSQNFDQVYPGWNTTWPLDSTSAEQAVDTTTMATYHNAVAVAQQQSQELDGEDFSRIFANDTSPNLLAVTQALLDAVGVDIQERRYQRQLEIAQLMVTATYAAQQLNKTARTKATAVASPIFSKGP